MNKRQRKKLYTKFISGKSMTQKERLIAINYHNIAVIDRRIKEIIRGTGTRLPLGIFAAVSARVEESIYLSVDYETVSNMMPPPVEMVVKRLPANASFGRWHSDGRIERVINHE